MKELKTIELTIDISDPFNNLLINKNGDKFHFNPHDNGGSGEELDSFLHGAKESAAPDLLEALQEMVLVFDRDDNDNAQHIRVGNAEKALN